MKVLVVENSSVICERLLTLLAMSGRYEGVGSRAGSAAALELAEVCDPDALLLGLRLDEGNGFEVLKALRGRGQTMPVVILAECNGRQYQMRAQALGASALLCRATQFEEIVPTLDRLLGAGVGETAAARRA